MKLELGVAILRPARQLILLGWLLTWPWLEPQAATAVVIWDTSVPLTENFDLKDRTHWNAVPGDITSLESDPAKAASDPGYYGRAYTFKGDAVVENASMTAVFWASEGKVALFSRALLLPGSGAESRVSPKPFAEVVLVQQGTPATRFTECAVRCNVNDEAVLEITASTPRSKDLTARFSLGRSGAIAIKPGQSVSGLRILSPLDYGVVPAFLGDDLVVSAADVEGGKPLCLPVENMFIGLVKGELHMLVMTWPSGNQTLQLGFGNQPGAGVVSADLQNGGKTVYLAALTAPGIWHKETFSGSYLERDTPSPWQRPFNARWKTLLTEAGVKATFTFRERKGQIWRGVPGSYIYPVWFEGDRAVYHTSKKVPPEGESVVYFLEADHTPLSIPTPADILRSTLGLDAAEAIIDPVGRQLRTHHRRAGAGVHRACTCGCTEAVQAVFEACQEVDRKEYIDGAVRDMVFFVEQHVARIEEYQQFARDALRFLKGQETAAPELKSYTDSLAQIPQQILDEHEAQKENMKPPSYTRELVDKTMRLTEKKEPRNLEAFMQLLKDWRAMGGAQDYVVAQCHVLARKLFQEAGAGALHEPRAIPMAKEIRARCRHVLRNPDGYEIWANY